MADFAPYRKLIDSTTGGPGKDIGDAFAGNEAPKLKFTWTMQIMPRDFTVVQSAVDMTSAIYAIKSFVRPKITVEYQDINMYNFRTKVATRVDYGTGTVSYYDDSVGRAHGILTNYLQAISPVSNVIGSQASSIDLLGSNSSIGPLATNRNGPVETITLTHYYYQNGGPHSTTYTYLNPKIANFDYDELTQEGSEAALVSFTFNYDSVNITSD